jgi:hypothetical protein
MFELVQAAEQVVAQNDLMIEDFTIKSQLIEQGQLTYERAWREMELTILNYRAQAFGLTTIALERERYTRTRVHNKWERERQRERRANVPHTYLSKERDTSHDISPEMAERIAKQWRDNPDLGSLAGLTGKDAASRRSQSSSDHRDELAAAIEKSEENAITIPPSDDPFGDQQ